MQLEEAEQVVVVIVIIYSINNHIERHVCPAIASCAYCNKTMMMTVNWGMVRFMLAGEARQASRARLTRPASDRGSLRADSTVGLTSSTYQIGVCDVAAEEYLGREIHHCD